MDLRRTPFDRVIAVQIFCFDAGAGPLTRSALTVYRPGRLV
jgi:hypothetical protein